MDILKSNIINFPPITNLATVLLTLLMTSLLPFRLIEASVINTKHIINQSGKGTMDRTSYTISLLVLYNFDPEYSVDELTVIG
jgi:hypothetical protein